MKVGLDSEIRIPFFFFNGFKYLGLNIPDKQNGNWKITWMCLWNTRNWNNQALYKSSKKRSRKGTCSLQNLNPEPWFLSSSSSLLNCFFPIIFFYLSAVALGIFLYELWNNTFFTHTGIIGLTPFFSVFLQTNGWWKKKYPLYKRLIWGFIWFWRTSYITVMYFCQCRK